MTSLTLQLFHNLLSKRYLICPPFRGKPNGGELPTTVIVDADGNIRRRFIGSRKLRTFDSMIVEAEKPLAYPQKQVVALK